MSTTKREARTVYLDSALWKRLRVRAVQDGTSASLIIQKLVTEYLTKSKERKEQQ
jgi:hypothetical protein